MTEGQGNENSVKLSSPGTYRSTLSSKAGCKKGVFQAQTTCEICFPQWTCGSDETTAFPALFNFTSRCGDAPYDGEESKQMKKRTVITTETREVWVISEGSITPLTTDQPQADVVSDDESPIPTDHSDKLLTGEQE